MKKLLSILGSLGITATGAASVMAMSPYQNNEQEKTTRGIERATDLTQWQIDDLDVHIYGQLNDESTELEKVKLILTDLVKAHPDKTEYLMLLTEYLQNSEGWVTTGLDGDLPDEFDSTLIEFSMIPIASTDYSGILSFRVNLINIPLDEIDISEIINVETIGKIEEKNVTVDYFKAYLLQNYPDLRELSYFDVAINDYGSITVTANNVNQNYYFGSVVVNMETFIDKFESDSTATDEARVDAYDGPDDDSKPLLWTYSPTLGMDKFKAYFTNVGIKTDGYVWNNHIDTHLHFYNDDDVPHPADSTMDPNLQPMWFGTNNKTANHFLFDENYTGSVNWMKAHGDLSIDWVDGELQIKIVAYAEAYASWVNAYWARSASKVWLRSVEFSRQ